MKETKAQMTVSPAAQAVLSAYNAGFDRPVAVHHKPRIAAALRAAVEAVIPIEYEKEWRDGRWHEYEKENPISVRLLAIADELEGSV